MLDFPDTSARTDDSYQLDLRVAQPLFGAVRIYFDALNVTNERRWDSYGMRGTSFVAGISGTFESF